MIVNGSKANTGFNDLIFSIHLYIILESQIIIIHFYTQNSVWYGSKLKRFLQISDCFQGCRSTARLSVGLDAQEKTGMDINIYAHFCACFNKIKRMKNNGNFMTFQQMG